MEIVRFEKGDMIQALNVPGGDVYFIIDGTVTLETKQDDDYVAIGKVSIGYEIGMFSAYTSGASLMRAVVASDSVILARIRHRMFANILLDPKIFIRCSRHLIQQFSDFVLQVDNYIDWGQLLSGEKLFQSGENCTAMYLIMSGRVRVVYQV